MMKRMRSSSSEEEETGIGKWLTMLTQYKYEAKPPPPSSFQCKTCGRSFSSFQALGGHRASHKKPRLDSRKVAAPKKHECSICGVAFSMGQALGGHMRRHKAPPLLLLKHSWLDLNLTPFENDLNLLFSYT